MTKKRRNDINCNFDGTPLHNSCAGPYNDDYVIFDEMTGVLHSTISIHFKSNKKEMPLCPGTQLRRKRLGRVKSIAITYMIHPKITKSTVYKKFSVKHMNQDNFCCNQPYGDDRMDELKSLSKNTYGGTVYPTS